MLLIVIVLFQGLVFLFNANFFKEPKKVTIDENWLALQTKIDSLKSISKAYKYEMQPFNPNFISDYKGGLLGLSVQEIDRLHTFRKTNKYVNSAAEFQQVTKVSDSLLQKIKVYFKFPDWVTNKKANNNYSTDYKRTEYKKEAIVLKDINSASKEDLMKVYGIGDKISDIILTEKQKFGSFASIEQLQFVWGVKPETFLELKKHFNISANTTISKISINDSSMKELAKFPYFNYTFAKQIVTYRSMNGSFKSINDLTNIKDCPTDKLEIIALYLDFN
jgi:DNA uptake protein ComE-like DNA-binding protein